MAQWVIGYVVGGYVSMAEIDLEVPGPIRRINAGFYVHNNTTVPVPLTPVVTADADNEVQISDPTTAAGKRKIKIYITAGLTNPVIFLFVETELGETGEKRTITA